MTDRTSQHTEQSQKSAQETSDLTAFEEERRILLNSMAEQLTSVIDRMAQANSNLERMASNDQPVQDIATLWRESYSKSSKP